MHLTWASGQTDSKGSGDIVRTAAIHGVTAMGDHRRSAGGGSCQKKIKNKSNGIRALRLKAPQELHFLAIIRSQGSFHSRWQICVTELRMLGITHGDVKAKYTKRIFTLK